jgi:hypothetical protein
LSFGLFVLMPRKPVFQPAGISRVELPLQAEIDEVFRPRRGTDRALRGVDARDAGHEEVGAAQVEARRERERHDRRRCVRVAHAGRHHADVLPVAVDDRIVGRQARHRDVAPRAEPVEPRLALRTEHRDDHDLDRAALCRGLGECSVGRRGRVACVVALMVLRDRRRGHRRRARRRLRKEWSESASAFLVSMMLGENGCRRLRDRV